MSVPVTVRTNPVPASFCPSNIRTDWPVLVSLIQASITGDLVSMVVSESTPDVADQEKPWMRLNADGTPDRIYYYANGYWLSRHSLAPGSIIMYEGTAASIDTYDGGEAGTVSKISGPMWERVTELDARIPLGVGTLAVSGTVVAEGAVGGVDQEDVAIETENMPSHRHWLGVEGTGLGHATVGFLRVGGGETIDFISSGVVFAARTEAEGDSEAIQLSKMPPYYGLYFLRRTAREYFRAP